MLRDDAQLLQVAALLLDALLLPVAPSPLEISLRFAIVSSSFGLVARVRGIRRDPDRDQRSSPTPVTTQLPRTLKQLPKRS